jgi:cytochrome P450
MVLRVIDEIDMGRTPAQRLSIFHTLLDPPTTDEYKKPKSYQPPSASQLTDDGVSMLVAAAFTTGNAMTVTAYHVLRDKKIYSQLRAEILGNFPDNPEKMDFQSLERLPYLVSSLYPTVFWQIANMGKNGTVKEGLRLSYGVIGRLPRCVPEGGAVFQDHFIPAGYKVGMSSWMMHRHPRIWPNCEKFDPTRWTDATEAKRLNKYMVAFGKDSRQCIGMK